MRARSLLFTIFGDFIIRYGQEVWIGSLITAMAEFGIQAPAVRMAVSRVAQEGLLEARKDGSKSYYRLTEKGLRRLEDGVRRVYRQAPEAWDGQWRIVAFTLPEDRPELRDQVRGELEWRGFGPLTSATWISPQRQEEAVRHLVEEYGLHGYLHQFTARYAGPAADSDLVARCWNLPSIGAKYDQFIAEVEPKFERMCDLVASGGEVPDSLHFVGRIELVHKFRSFLHVDPGLPVDLLPEDWTGARALQLFWEYYRLLSGGAERFFLQMSYSASSVPKSKAKREPKRLGTQGVEGPITGSRHRRSTASRREW